MKKLICRIFCIVLCALALACSAALAEPAFTLDTDGYITAIAMDSEAEMLIIPDKVGGTDVRGIREGVFSSYTNLKIILLEVPEYRGLEDYAFDFTSAPNLEYLYTKEDANYTPPKIKFNSGVTCLHYVEVYGKEIRHGSIVYENGAVNLAFDDIIGQNPKYSYHITRTEQGSGAFASFDSETNSGNFASENGRVRFIDDSVRPGQEYSYSIVAVCPFGRTSIPYEAGISIPAEPTSPEPDDPSLPETGDGANLILWSALVCISLMGVMTLRRRKEA